MSVIRKEVREKNEIKIRKLKKKYLPVENKEKIQEEIRNFENLKIFRNELEEEEALEGEVDIPTVGVIVPPLDKDEIAALRLPPKTAMRDNLCEIEFKVDVEMCNTKTRWEINKIDGEKLDEDDTEEVTEKEKEVHEIEEAKTRLPYDPIRLELDLKKRKVTDLKDNSRIILPKPLRVTEEAKISIRGEAFEKVFKEYVNENCDKKGKQEPNLSKSQMRGISKLKKRVKEGEIVIMESDKSGKLSVATTEKYLEMGEVHVGKDIEIDEEDLKEREKFLNGHVSMFLKISNMGEDWGHQQRHREAGIKHSAYASPMSLLLKDHKKWAEGDLPQTRPVVSGNEGLGTSMSNIVSEFLEPLADSEEENFEIISSEDLLYRVRICNEIIKKEWDEKTKTGELEDMPELVMIGADVKALFPSIKSRRTGRIVREAALRSRLKFKGINYRTAALYVRLGMDHFEIRALGLEKIVPKRKYHTGTEPGITGREALSGNPEKDELRWEFPVREPSEKEKIYLMAACLEIGVRTCFEHHVYQFGGRYYLQKSGGPIGMRITMAAARLVMCDWGLRMKEIFSKASIQTYLKAVYVDDKRSLLPAIKKGTRWVDKKKSFEFREDWRKEDAELGESSTRRTANEMRKAMDSINPDLNFEIELEEDFPGQKLPTLDTNLWIDRKVGAPPELRYEFFEKPMCNKLCMLEQSAMTESSKIAILSQDLVRRMLNTDVKTSQSRRNEIVDSFTAKLKRSGYKKTQIIEIAKSGLKCFMRKVRSAEKSGLGLHRSSGSTLEGRHRKKILAKTTWYRTGKKNDGCDKGSTRRREKKEKPNNKKNPGETEIRSVLFVPRTKGGELARRLRNEEEKMAEITGYRVKIVEKSGSQVRRTLCSKNPWAGSKCQRENCMVCKQEGGKGDCRRRNVVYQTSCVQCKGEEGEGDKGEKGGTEREKIACYVGETSKSGYERGKKHQEDYGRLELDSHILKHQILKHGEEEKISFSMQIIKKHSSAFKRQVHEAVLVEILEGRGGNILNSKGGFNRCTLPRLSIKMGEKEHTEGDTQEKEMTDFEIEMEINKMRRERKIRKRGGKEENHDQMEENEEGPATKKKRKWRINFDKGRRRKQEEMRENGGEEDQLQGERRRLAVGEENDEKTGGASKQPGPTAQASSLGQQPTLQEGQVQHFENDVSSHEVNGRKSNIMNIINLFENLSKKQEIEKFTAKNPQKKATQISSGEIKDSLESNSKPGVGAGVGGRKRGDGCTYSDKKAKLSSAQKRRTALKSNDRPITNFFKPTIERESPVVGGNNRERGGAAKS